MPTISSHQSDSSTLTSSTSISNELDKDVTLVDLAANLQLQVAVVLQAAALTDAGIEWQVFHGRPIFSLVNILKIANSKPEIEKILRIVSNALNNKDDQYKIVAPFDRDALHLAMSCLIDYVHPGSINNVHEKQPWRFFLARIGVMVKQSSLSNSAKQNKLTQLDYTTEPLSEYIAYLFKEIDAESQLEDPDRQRIYDMENEVDRLQNTSSSSFRRWRQN